MRVTLTPHPTTPGPDIEITVEAERRGERLWLRYVVDGDVDGLEWPTPATGRADDLWKHTCFEVFVRTADGYREFNLSPSGQWAGYRFDGYREGMAQAAGVAEAPVLGGGADYVGLETVIDLPPGAQALGLSAVIEETDGRISCWALAHPSDKPDFHHPDSFVLEIP